MANQAWQCCGRLDLRALYLGALFKRADWRGWLMQMSWGILYCWPSGATHLWDPTNEDLTATDWERK